MTVGRYECPPGLAYSQESHTCLWISEVPDCSFKTIPIDETEEFVCPADTPAGAFTKHPHPLDCRQFFLCIGGVPREQGCPLGEVFSSGRKSLSPLADCWLTNIISSCQAVALALMDSARILRTFLSALTITLATRRFCTRNPYRQQTLAGSELTDFTELISLFTSSILFKQIFILFSTHSPFNQNDYHYSHQVLPSSNKDNFNSFIIIQRETTNKYVRREMSSSLQYS